MNVNNHVQVIVFVLVVGIAAYLAGAWWSAHFVITVPETPSACAELVDVDASGELRCVAYTSHLDRLKHAYNQHVLRRQDAWFFGSVAAGAIVGLLAFSVIPRLTRKRRRTRRPADGLTAVLIGGLTVAIVPMVLGWILPDPATWLPNSATEAGFTRAGAVLDSLTNEAARLEALTR